MRATSRPTGEAAPSAGERRDRQRRRRSPREDLAAASRTSSAVVVSSSAMRDAASAQAAQVDPPRVGGVDDASVCSAALPSTRTVSKKRSVRDRDAEPLAARAASTAARPCTRSAMARRPSRPVVDGVHAGHHREQHLRGADVAGRLLAADVLLARLQRHAQRRLAVRVLGDADEAARAACASNSSRVAKKAACGPP